MMNEEPTIDRKRNDDPMTSALTRTSAVTRRAVLTGIAATGATALGACTSSAQLTDMRGDYSGEIKFDSYDTSAGTYEPATREHRAKNTPKTRQTRHIDNKTVAGIYSALGHYAAAITYAINTGEDHLYSAGEHGGGRQKGRVRVFWETLHQGMGGGIQVRFHP